MIPAERVYEQLKANMPERIWWPADSKWEIIAGAILVQNTNWRNVERSLDNLWEATAFEPEKIVEYPLEKIQELVRPSGFYTNKGKTIKAIFLWLQQFSFCLATIKERYDKASLRKQLLSIRGIGDETADVLLVYIFEEVEFIADRYAQRLFERLGVQKIKGYSDLKSRVSLPPDFSSEEAQAFHVLILDFGKEFLKNDAAWEASFLSDFTLEA